MNNCINEYIQLMMKNGIGNQYDDADLEMLREFERMLEGLDDDGGRVVERKPTCSCGAAYTSNKNHHLRYCDLNENN